MATKDKAAPKEKAAKKKAAAPAKKKAVTAKPAAKKAAASNGDAGAVHREAVVMSWRDPNVAARRAVKSKVKVGGVEYRSVLHAFEQLGLPVSKHQAFRLELKEKGKARFEGHQFSLSA